MTKKNIFPVVATIAVVGVVLGVFSTTVLRDSNVSISTMTSEQAYANLSSKMKRIGVQEVSVNPQQLDVSEFLDAKDELPNIDSSYPFVVEGNGDVNIEIFSSGEKAAESGSDSFLTSMAKKFKYRPQSESQRGGKEHQEHPEVLLRHGLLLRRCRTGQEGLLQVHDLVSGYPVHGVPSVFCVKEQLRYEAVPDVRRNLR